MHSISVFLFAAVLALSTSYVAAHGYLYFPPPRGIEKEAYQIDALKSPNNKGLCRGEPVGKITPVVPGGSITLKFHITAPHVGPCTVYVLDENLQNPKKIAEKMNCAAPGQGGPWTFGLPSGLSGHKVLRWTWDGQHVSPSEPYEQCIDVNFGGQGGDAPEKEYEGAEEEEKPQKNGPMSHRRPSYSTQVEEKQTENYAQEQPENYAQEQPENYAQDEPAGDDYNGEDQDDTPANSYEADDEYDGEGDSGDESCPTNGAFVCKGSKFAQCANGKWVTFACPTGTSCKAVMGESIICANNY